MNKCRRFLFIIIVMVLCCFCSFLGYIFPDSQAMRNNVTESETIFEKEGNYPNILKLDNSQLDNFTDKLMIRTAGYVGEESVLDKMFSNYHAVGELRGGDKAPYSRYWHGYVPFLRGALQFTNYGGIRQVNSIFQILMFVMVIYSLVKREMSKIVLPYVVFWIILNPMALQLSLQYSSVYYITSIAIMLMIWMHEEIKEKIGYIAFFASIGVITNWLDFLTYPIVTLGIPLTVLMILEKKSLGEQIKGCVLLSMSWALGYLGMWALKWLLSTIALHKNVFAEALDAIVFRTSVSHNDHTWTKMATIVYNMRHLCHKSYCFLYTLPILYSFFDIYRKRKIQFFHNLIFLGIACMPFVWYFVLSNHSYMHNWFTYRSLGVSVFALSCFFMNLVPDDENESVTIKEKNSEVYYCG